MKIKVIAVVLSVVILGGCGTLSIKKSEVLKNKVETTKERENNDIRLSTSEEIEGFNKIDELEYKISAGDIINLKTTYKTIDDTDYIVNVTGYINVEKIGNILATGKTLEEVEKEINNRMSEYYKSEKIILNFKKISNNISILGEIKSPGIIPIEGKITLIEAIARVGGFNDGKSKKKYYSRVVGVNGASVIIDLSEILENGDAKKNIFLKKNDMVYIFSKEGNGIYIFGDIAKAGKYDYYDGVSILEALIIAGGPTKYSKLDKIFVIRTDKEKKVRVYGCELERIINKKDSEMIYLQNKDIVYIGKSMIGNVNSAIESILPPLMLTNSVLSPIESINNLMMTE